MARSSHLERVGRELGVELDGFEVDALDQLPTFESLEAERQQRFRREQELAFEAVGSV